jgi:CRP/FNR family transcriptional regulator
MKNSTQAGTRPSLATLAASFPALGGLDAGLATRLANETQWLRLPRHTELFTRGSPCRAFPLLLAGEIQVLRSTPDGREIELYRVAPGESCIVSTSCLLGDADYPARGVATSDIVLGLVARPLFDALIADHAPFRRYVFGLFAERLGAMMQRVEDMAFLTLAQRIAARLLGAAGETVETTHDTLAAQVGASREAVSRTLKRLEATGCIARARGRIRILDRAALARFV